MDQDMCNDGGIGVQLDDVELIGKYRGSGLQDPPYLLRRRDGQVVQVSRLLYLIAGCLDPRRHPSPSDRRADEIAARVSLRFGQEISPENVTYLIDRKLRPAGLIAADPSHTGSGNGTAAGAHDRANPLLSLRMRLPMVPERLHRSVSTACEPLFRPAVVVAALVGLVVADAWLVLTQRHELVDGARQLVYQPQLLLLITVLTIASAAFHEIGHAAAARYSGATPGAMGAGIYLVWPVFYTDVTDAYRLDRRGRLRTDLGGVYFNVLFALGVTAVNLVTGFRPLLVFLVVAQLETLRQFLPFVRLDGYYVVSDLAGVPNLFAYMRPVLVLLLRRGDETAQHMARTKLAELQPRSRAIITAWVCLTAPVLAVNVVGFLLLAPRFAGAAWGSAAGQLQEMTTRGHVDVVGVVNGLLGLAFLVLPLVGMAYVAVRLVARASTGVRGWWEAQPLVTATAGVVAATLVALQVAVEWPGTFSNALEHAQVAQAIEEAQSEGRADEVAVATSPAADAISLPDELDATAPSTSLPTSTTLGNGSRSPRSGGAAGRSGSGASGGDGGDGGDGSEDGTTAGDGWTGTIAPSGSFVPSGSGGTTSVPTSSPTTSAPATGVQSGSRGSSPSTTGGSSGGSSGGSRPPGGTTVTTSPSPSSPPATTTTTTAPPSSGSDPGLVEVLLDLLF